MWEIVLEMGINPAQVKPVVQVKTPSFPCVSTTRRRGEPEWLSTNGDPIYPYYWEYIHDMREELTDGDGWEGGITRKGITGWRGNSRTVEGRKCWKLLTQEKGFWTTTYNTGFWGFSTIRYIVWFLFHICGSCVSTVGLPPVLIVTVRFILFYLHIQLILI